MLFFPPLPLASRHRCVLPSRNPSLRIVRMPKSKKFEFMGPRTTEDLINRSNNTPFPNNRGDEYCRFECKRCRAAFLVRGNAEQAKSRDKQFYAPNACYHMQCQVSANGPGAGRGL